MPKRLLKKVCIYCRKEFHQLDNIHQHIKNNHKFRCEFCRLTFKSRETCQKHFRIRHSKNISKNEIVIRKTKGATWCITCMCWSRGCRNSGHTTIFRVFNY